MPHEDIHIYIRQDFWRHILRKERGFDDWLFSSEDLMILLYIWAKIWLNNMGNRPTNFSSVECSLQVMARGKKMEKFQEYFDLQHDDINSSN